MKILVVLPIFLFCGSSWAYNKEPLRVSIFYETYCPDCIFYMKDQLFDVWKSFKSKISLDLLPFGNAEQKFVDGHWVFDCQHGPKECLGNKLQACAISQACEGNATIDCPEDEVTKVLTFNTCVEAHHDQLQATSECAKKATLEANDIIACAKGNKGDTLLNFYGNRTLAFSPRIQYVPSVAMNGIHDTAAEDNLKDEICRLRPDLCKFLSPEIIQV